MKNSQPVVLLKAFLILTLLVLPSWFAQSPNKRTKTPPRKPDVSADVIAELLKLTPLEPEEPEPVAAPETATSDDDEEKPPADDAPIRELLEYWSGDSASAATNAPKPSERVCQRLLDAGENRPWLLPGLLSVLPDATDTHDRLYKLLTESPDDEAWRESVKDWLQLRSSYFRAELVASLQSEELALMQTEKLRALARLDWEAARPLMERYGTSYTPLVTTLSWALQYKHAVETGETAGAEQWRAKLKGIVANRQSFLPDRAAAFQYLVDTEWNGQQEWVLSLFNDPSLSRQKVAQADNASPEAKEKSKDEGYEDYGSTAPPILSVLVEQPDKWLPVIRQLVGHDNKTIHNAAVSCLVFYVSSQEQSKKLRKEAAQALLPWLSNPAWATSDARSAFVGSLADLNLPESVPGLIWMLDYDEKDYARAQAASALTKYRDPRAIPALRRLLEREASEAWRDSIVTALAMCGGISDEEAATATEAYARKVVTEDGAAEIERAKNDEADKPLPLDVSIGRILFESETIPATEGMAAKLFERAKALRKTEPAVAQKILDGIEGVPLQVAKQHLIERLSEGWIDAYAVSLLLDNRDELRKNFSTEIYALLKQGGHAAGVALMLLDDESRQADVLKGADVKAQRAMLASARYLRDALPVEIVGGLLNSRDKLLATAAEAYLAIEDSAAARRLLLARHPGEALITGDLSTIGEHLLPSINQLEAAMRREVKQPGGPDEIYVLLQSWEPEGFKKIVIRIRGEQAELSVYEDAGWRNLRALTASELQEVRDFTSQPDVESLPPERIERIPGTTGDFEFLKLSKAGGRRVMLKGAGRAPHKDATLHEQLSGLFDRLSRTGEFKVRYDIEDLIPGVEILFADKKQKAEMACLEGRELRVLVSEASSKQRRIESAEILPEWYAFKSGQLVQKTDEPSACRVLGVAENLENNVRFLGSRGFPFTASRAGEAVYFSGSIDGAAGIGKLQPGRSAEKILSGEFFPPVVTPDEKWLVTMKAKRQENKEGEWELVRINLLTKEEFIVTLPAGRNADDWITPITFIAAHKKILLGSRGFYGSMQASQLLLDPETGVTQTVSGDFRPLLEEFSVIRPLQPAGKPDQFWAAVYDGNRKAAQVGRYDTVTFSFKPVLEIPELRLTSLDIYVDAAERKLYLTCRGHLLRLPLPAEK